MYFFFHLATGILLGLIIADLLHDGRWLIPCGIGAVLPDLIDKPVGYLLLANIGYARILFHTFLALVLILSAGIVLWGWRRIPAGLALAVGMFSHHVFDSMWNEPANWFFPFLGPPLLTRNIPAGYLFLLLKDDFLNPMEWAMAALLVAGLLLWLQKDRLLVLAQKRRKELGPALEIGGVLLWMAGGIVFSWGLTGRLSLPFGTFWLANYTLLSLFCALAAFLLWRWGASLAPASITG